MKQQHPDLEISAEDVIEKSWTKRQKAASQLLKKLDAVSQFCSIAEHRFGFQPGLMQSLRKLAHVIHCIWIFLKFLKLKIFSRIFFYIFLIFAQNTDCGYMLLTVLTIYVLEQK